MSTDYMQAFLRHDRIPFCPACFLGAGNKRSRQVELNVASVSALHNDGRVFVGYVAICPTCRLAVPLQPLERRTG